MFKWWISINLFLSTNQSLINQSPVKKTKEKIVLTLALTKKVQIACYYFVISVIIFRKCNTFFSSRHIIKRLRCLIIRQKANVKLKLNN